MTSLYPPGFPIRFGAVQEVHRPNRSSRLILTEADAQRYGQVKRTAAHLDAALIEAGLDTGENSAQLKLSTHWPHNYIQVSVADEAVKAQLETLLNTLGAKPDARNPNLFWHEGQRVNVLTYAEADYRNGLPFTFLARKFRELKVVLREKFGFPQIPS